ncbi:fatty acid desaturase [Acinetobacter sp. R933-2]|uniref:fatty acid desaturase family protein n=1 Tax=Acinetobacter sp. R933-2 TaxID=2746728 RepID=UPI00257812B0|nr:fatty acid desaturase [Acinetobacter sp. R933-2]MDM1247949.1 fatty acid desaturase [Acinetobacter sp. R933-2]
MNDQQYLLKVVQWKDLVHLQTRDVISELLISIPWLCASLAFAYLAWYPLALFCSFMFFLTGLRQVHNAFHFALGISREKTHWVMWVLSILMLGSMHAVQINHLRHHQFCMQDEDVEAKSARMKWWQALLFGPFFPLMLHQKAFKVGTKTQKKWMLAELIANVLFLVLVFAILDFTFLKYHVLAMLIGQCMTAFFAVWTVHHDTEDHIYMARTVRNEFKRVVTYNMFYHVEHHLFPAVPTRHLHVLAKRLDAYDPNVEIREVF